jgi:hypothetical protein
LKESPVTSYVLGVDQVMDVLKIGLPLPIPSDVQKVYPLFSEAITVVVIISFSHEEHSPSELDYFLSTSSS